MNSPNPLKLFVPIPILGVVPLAAVSADPLFEMVNETTVKLNNPQFVQVRCLLPHTEGPTCNEMTTIDGWITNGLKEYWSGVPSNSGGNSPLAWSNWPSGAIDWRSGGSFNVSLPRGGVYWLQSRGPDLSLQSFVVDTRWTDPPKPTNVNAQDLGNQTARITWNDNSDNETVFHIIVEKYVGDKWVKISGLPYIRCPKNTTSYDWRTTPGYYRFAMRAAISNALENWSFSRLVSTRGDAENISFSTPAVLKYSEVTGWKTLLVNGTFPNPIAPTNFVGTLNADKTISFVWRDNSSNESIFHLLEDKFISGAWVRQPLIRIPANSQSYTLPARTAGRYRYAIRSAYSFPNTDIVRTSPITPWLEFTVP